MVGSAPLHVRLGPWLAGVGLAASLGAAAPAWPPGQPGTVDPSPGREQLADAERVVFVACAQAHLADLAGLRPDDPQRALVRVYAATCLRRAGRWDDAVEQYTRAFAESPRGSLRESLLPMLVRGHLAVARYADALARAEQFTAEYPAHPEAPDMLLEAARLQIALGRPDRALASLDAFERQYARRDPARAAAVFWARRELLRDDTQRLAHAQAYLARHGRAGGVERAVVAEATVAQLRWRRACGRASAQDLCISWHELPAQVGPDARGPARCEPLRAGVRAVFARREPLAGEAQRGFAAVVRAAAGAQEDPGGEPQRSRELADAVATARLGIADRRLEELLALAVPTDLRFANDPKDPRSGPRVAASTRRFQAYLQTSQRLAQELERAYAEIAGPGAGPDGQIAAAARIAVLAAHQADVLITAPIPAELAREPLTAAYCAALRNAVAPMRQQARAALEHCVARSVRLGHVNAWSRWCEAALVSDDPAGYPPLAEIVGEPRFTTSGSVTIPVQTEAVFPASPSPASTR